LLPAKKDGAMTETEWLACTSPGPMLELLGDRAGERPLRLFACACCRRAWSSLSDERSRRVVEVAERYAEGKVLGKAVRLARCAARAAIRAVRLKLRRVATAAARTANPNLSWQVADHIAAEVSTHLAREEAGEPGRARAAEEASQAALLRDLFHPFTPPRLDPWWLAANGGVVAMLTQAIDTDQDFAALPVLADALEEAGCAEAGLLGHLRGQGPHLRGCWALQLLRQPRTPPGA
jgi:hypothetical protein